MFDVLLERTVTERAIAQDRYWDEAEPNRFADQVGCNFAPGKGGFGKIPQRLFAAPGFVYGRDFPPFTLDVYQEGVIRAKRELAFKLDLPLLKVEAKNFR
jgi:hypothetical protein